MTGTKVNSVEHLKELASNKGDEDFEGNEFSIFLNGRLRSSKIIIWDEASQSFCIHNGIDDTHQDLTEAELATETNIVKAIENGAFWMH